jgi:hypothetical protein
MTGQGRPACTPHPTWPPQIRDPIDHLELAWDGTRRRALSASLERTTDAG